ncbi:bifunctional phosphoribosylaminoimidazolecarboxamide formyltransferase/inosine monophosphate cyclohydrolase, partial [Bifidobacteriaceae bacterium NR016]
MQQTQSKESNANVLITTGEKQIRRVLVSVFHKEGLEILAEAFRKADTEVVSTGSTAAKLAELGVHVIEVSDITGFPESLDGRVKTLDPHIHAGILADMSNADHVKQLERLNIKPFDAVVVNLYPFVDTVMSGADSDAIIEKIDIGGPSMIRAAAKNHKSVVVITDPADYQLLA